MSITELLTRAIRVLEELDAAIDAQNYRVIGARLYELRRLLEAARSEAQETRRSHDKTTGRQ